MKVQVKSFRQSSQRIVCTKKCAPDLQKSYIQNDIISKNEFNALTKVFEDQTKNDVSKSIMDYDNEPTKFILSEIKNIFMIQESSNMPQKYEGTRLCRIFTRKLLLKTYLYLTSVKCANTRSAVMLESICITALLSGHELNAGLLSQK